MQGVTHRGDIINPKVMALVPGTRVTSFLSSFCQARQCKSLHFFLHLFHLSSPFLDNPEACAYGPNDNVMESLTGRPHPVPRSLPAALCRVFPAASFAPSLLHRSSPFLESEGNFQLFPCQLSQKARDGSIKHFLFQVSMVSHGA